MYISNSFLTFFFEGSPDRIMGKDAQQFSISYFRYIVYPTTPPERQAGFNSHAGEIVHFIILPCMSSGKCICHRSVCNILPDGEIDGNGSFGFMETRRSSTLGLPNYKTTVWGFADIDWRRGLILLAALLYIECRGSTCTLVIIIYITSERRLCSAIIKIE
jgi:hypothetical protein